jgi:hypothetical protein
MANFALTDAYLLINAVNMSTMARKVTLKTSAAELDNTAFGGGGYHSRIGGLKDWSLDIEWNQDFAASQVDPLLFPLLGTVSAVEIRPTSGARSATNPAYTGSVLISDYVALDDQVGELAKGTTSWKGATTLTRATS